MYIYFHVCLCFVNLQEVTGGRPRPLIRLPSPLSILFVRRKRRHARFTHKKYMQFIRTMYIHTPSKFKYVLIKSIASRFLSVEFIRTGGGTGSILLAFAAAAAEVVAGSS